MIIGNKDGITEAFEFRIPDDKKLYPRIPVRRLVPNWEKIFITGSGCVHLKEIDNLPTRFPQPDNLVNDHESRDKVISFFRKLFSWVYEKENKKPQSEVSVGPPTRILEVNQLGTFLIPKTGYRDKEIKAFTSMG